MAEWEKDGADDDPGFGIRAGDGGDCGQHAGGQRALRGFNTGLGIFIAGVAVVAATDVGAFWMFHRLRALVDQYGWGNVPPEAVPPFDILEHWGRLIDLGAAVLYGTGFFMAMLNARRLAEAIGIRGWTYGWGWTVGTIFIPIACLFRPWLGLAEIRRAIVDSAAAGRPTAGEGFSAFTLLLGASLFIFIIVDRRTGYGMDNLSGPASPAGFYAFIEHASGLLLTLVVVQAVMLGVMLAYLLTIRSRAVRLANLIDLEAFD